MSGDGNSEISKEALLRRLDELARERRNIEAELDRMKVSEPAAADNVVAVNSLGAVATNKVEIRVLFIGANNAPVQNIRVWFDLDRSSGFPFSHLSHFF